MFKHNFKIATRNLLRNKAYASLNIAGLAIGMASSILILLWSQNELSYDRFHSKAGQIYRLVCSAGDFKAAVSPAGIPGHLQREFPQVKSALRISKPGKVLFEVGERKFEEERVFFADSNFLDMFDFHLIEGNRKTALAGPESILITESMGRKYFPDEVSPIGQLIKKDNSDNFIVRGVLKDPPPNSHLQFDFVLPMSFLARTHEDLINDVWDSFNFYSYLELDASPGNEASDETATEAQINKIYSDRFPQVQIDFNLQPLVDIHLYSNLQIDLSGHGNALYVKIFSAIAFFILIVACINFMNLATARSSRRAKEIGLKKVVGAERSQLIWQFLSESLVISMISIVLAIVIVYLGLPYFNQLAGKQLSLEILDLNVLLSLAVIGGITGLVSGSYPALFLSGFNPLSVLNGKSGTGRNNSTLRNALVIAQFVISMVMLVGTVVIYDQLSFIRNKNLGFDKSNLLYVSMSGEMWGKQQALRSVLSQDPLTGNYSIISDIPTNITQGDIEIDWEGKDPDSQVVIPSMRVDDSFVEVFDMEILRGRNFSENLSSDSARFVINEKMVSIMGLTLDNAVGRLIDFKGTKGQVIGIVKDFNYKPLQYEIEPLILHRHDYGAVLVVKVQPDGFEQTINALSGIYTEMNPAHPFTYGFIDQELERNYRGEQKMGTIFNLFAFLAIFISSIGLYGLSAFVAERHQKEIGIRKVLGANILGLVRLLSGQFVRLALVALVIAVPISWYLMSSWLTDFVYRTNVSWWIYLASGMMVLLVTLITISHQVISTALMNPVKSLRTE